jgi:hypothetical protein
MRLMIELQSGGEEEDEEGRCRCRLRRARGLEEAAGGGVWFEEEGEEGLRGVASSVYHDCVRVCVSGEGLRCVREGRIVVC